MEPFYYYLLNYKEIALGLARINPITDYLKPLDVAYLRGWY